MPAKSLELQHTIRLIRELDDEIVEIEEQIQAIMDELHSPITTIPGLGFRMAAMIFAEVGDFTRFDSPDKLLAYAGDVSLYLTSPGSSKIVTPHMEKRGSRYLRYALYNATSMSATGTQPLLPILLRSGRRASTTMVALSHAAKKLVRSDIFYGEIQAAILLSGLSATTRIASRGLTRSQLCYTFFAPSLFHLHHSFFGVDF